MASAVLSNGAKDLFDTDLFVDRADLVKYNLICPICTYAADQIVDTPCGHLFCRACILASVHATKPECPVCRKSLQIGELHTSAYLQRMVDDMRVRCLHHDCKEWNGRRGDLAKHLTDCGHVPIPCRWCRTPHKRSTLQDHENRTCPRREITCDHCHMSMTAEHMTDHKSQCPALPITCPNDCQTVTLIPRAQLAHHLSTSCPLAESPCPYGRWGCEFGGKKGTLSVHLSDTTAMVTHISLLERQCGRADAALTDAEAKDRRRDQIIQQQQSAITLLQQQVTQLVSMFNGSAASASASASSLSSSFAGLTISSTPLVDRQSQSLMTPAKVAGSNGTVASYHHNDAQERKGVLETPKRGSIPSSSPSNTNSLASSSIHASRAPPPSTRHERKTHHLRLQVGLFFDIQDTYGKWLEAEIIKVSGNKCLVHYLKWDSKWDEWFVPDDEPYRVADFHQYSSGDITSRYTINQRVLIYPPKPRPHQWYEGEVAKIDGQNVLVLYKAKESRWWFHAESDCIVALD